MEQVTIEEVLPTRIWIESGMCGERAVMMQHKGWPAFEYAVFHYDYAYTSNSGTHEAAENLARSLGAAGPIEHTSRELSMPTAGELRAQIAAMTEMLADMDDGNEQPRKR